MSRSNPTDGSPNPATRWFEWKSSEKKFQYYDKQAKEVVQVKLPTEQTVQMGLIVDSVEEVVNLTSSEIEPTPEFGARVDTSYLLGMAKVKGQVKTLLDLDRVVAPETIQALAQVK